MSWNFLLAVAMAGALPADVADPLARRGERCPTTMPCGAIEGLDTDGRTRIQLWCRSINSGGFRYITKEDLPSSGPFLYGCGTGRYVTGVCRGGVDCQPKGVSSIVRDGDLCGEGFQSEFGVGLDGGHQCWKVDGRWGWRRQEDIASVCRRPGCHDIRNSRGDMFCAPSSCPPVFALGSGVGECLKQEREKPRECREGGGTPSPTAQTRGGVCRPQVDPCQSTDGSLICMNVNNSGWRWLDARTQPPCTRQMNNCALSYFADRCYWTPARCYPGTGRSDAVDSRTGAAHGNWRYIREPPPEPNPCHAQMASGGPGPAPRPPPGAFRLSSERVAELQEIWNYYAPLTRRANLNARPDMIDARLNPDGTVSYDFSSGQRVTVAPQDFGAIVCSMVTQISRFTGDASRSGPACSGTTGTGELASVPRGSSPLAPSGREPTPRSTTRGPGAHGVRRDITPAPFVTGVPVGVLLDTVVPGTPCRQDGPCFAKDKDNQGLLCANVNGDTGWRWISATVQPPCGEGNACELTPFASTCPRPDWDDAKCYPGSQGFDPNTGHSHGNWRFVWENPPPRNRCAGR